GTAVSNGLFTATLDFGPGIFTGSNYWLEVDVRTNGAGSYTALSPLQAITPTPYALYAPAAGSANAVLAQNITGAISLAQLPVGVLTNGAAGVNLSGTFSGNGAGVTNLNASQITSGTLNAAQLPANVATLNANQTFSGANVFSRSLSVTNTAPAQGVSLYQNGLASGFAIRSTNGQPLAELGVAWYPGEYSADAQPGDVVLRASQGGRQQLILQTGSGGAAIIIEETTNNLSNIIGGTYSAALAGASGATIGGGYANSVANNSSFCTVGGGADNIVSNFAATVSGGYANQATGAGSMVPGGGNNIASGQNAFAAGTHAFATNNGVFVWADSQSTTNFNSTGPNQFLIRAAGGVGINTNAPSGTLTINTGVGALTFRNDNGIAPGLVSDAGYLRFRNRLEVWPNDDATVSGYVDVRNTSGNPTISLDGQSGTITCMTLNQTSDRNAKENFAPVNVQTVLAKVCSLPLAEWNYKTDPVDEKHL
ncbi:MAG TPA: hypothetical protein VFB55_03100, partial [Verrucomicrobiae bacterium]|nr:hypothetical protein [Verrucomicrobiae bacterium]